jgi:hypothetical protein
MIRTRINWVFRNIRLLLNRNPETEILIYKIEVKATKISPYNKKGFDLLHSSLLIYDQNRSQLTQYEEYLLFYNIVSYYFLRVFMFVLQSSKSIITSDLTVVLHSINCNQFYIICIKRIIF